MQQVSAPGPAWNNIQILVENITDPVARTTRWTAYASSVDNVTGDSWSMVGFTAPVPAATP
jgi:hypothetical protein